MKKYLLVLPFLLAGCVVAVGDRTPVRTITVDGVEFTIFGQPFRAETPEGDISEYVEFSVRVNGSMVKCNIITADQRSPFIENAAPVNSAADIDAACASAVRSALTRQARQRERRSEGGGGGGYSPPG